MRAAAICIVIVVVTLLLTACSTQGFQPNAMATPIAPPPPGGVSLTPTARPTPTPTQVPNTTSLAQQVSDLAKRLKALENNIGVSNPLSGSLESRVAKLEQNVGGGFGREYLGSRVSALESKVGTDRFPSYLQSDSLARRVDSLESKVSDLQSSLNRSTRGW